MDLLSFLLGFALVAAYHVYITGRMRKHLRLFQYNYELIALSHRLAVEIINELKNNDKTKSNVIPFRGK